MAHSVLKQHATLPLRVRSKSMCMLEVIKSFYSSVEPFIRNSPIFRQCPGIVRRSIIKNNVPGVGSLNAMIVGVDSNLHQSEVHVAASSELYGMEFMRANYRVLQRLEPNRNLLKLFLIVLTFATNSSLVQIDNRPVNSSVFSSMYLLQIQNFLTTVFWKYLIYQYGFFEAAKRFSNLIKCFLDVLSLTYQNSNGDHWKMVDNITEQINETLVGPY